MRSPTGLTSTLTLLGALATGTGGCGNLTEAGTADVAYTPEGRLVAFLPGEARVYDGEVDNEIRAIATTPPVDVWPGAAGYELSGDGRTFAAATGRWVEVYDLETGKNQARITVNDEPDPPYAQFTGLAITNDGRFIAVARETVTTGAARLGIWRVADGALVRDIAKPAVDGDGKGGWGQGLAFSPDGAVLYGLLIIVSTDSSLIRTRLMAWSVQDGTTLWTRELPTDLYASPLALSADGALIATGGRGINLWRAVDGQHVDAFAAEPQKAPASVLALSPDGSHVAATYGTNYVPADAIVFGPDGAITQAFPVEGGGCGGITFSPDGARVAAACLNVKIWDVATGELLHRRSVKAYLY